MWKLGDYGLHESKVAQAAELLLNLLRVLKDDALREAMQLLKGLNTDLIIRMVTFSKFPNKLNWKRALKILLRFFVEHCSIALILVVVSLTDELVTPMDVRGN